MKDADKIALMQWLVDRGYSPSISDSQVPGNSIQVVDGKAIQTKTTIITVTSQVIFTAA